MGKSYEDYLSDVSLFSGSGGLDIGVERLGFQIKLANGSDKILCKIYDDKVDILESLK